ncbi:MAG: hypothetical protein JZU53_04890 [Paludibacter sp.]|nr:hypothetical protein [Paludibacter sp.]
MGTQEQDNYLNATLYENFLERAFQHDRRIRRGHLQELRNLMNAENGISSTYLGSQEKQLKEVKQRLLKAIEIFISIQPENEELFKLIDLVNCSCNSTDIIIIVEKGLDCTK